METPGVIHQYSKKSYPNRIARYDYPTQMKVMNVLANGYIRWRSNYWVYMTRGLIGKQVAAQEEGNGIWKVFYRNVFLGYFNENDLRDKNKTTRLSTILV